MPRREIIPIERIEQKIFLLRGQKVMLSFHLAELYEVEPRALIQAVKRNGQRFPKDFVFQLKAEELARLKSQIVISNDGVVAHDTHPTPSPNKASQCSPASFAVHAPVQVNVEIMRAFVRLRQLIASHEDLARKLDALERK